MPSSENHLEELVRRGRELQISGKSVSIETLCHDCPELMGEVRRRLDVYSTLLPPSSTSESRTTESYQAPVQPIENGELFVGGEPVPGYTLVKRLGGGGYGEVWKALAPGGFSVALKFVSLTSEGVTVEQRSLEIIKSLRHPNLITTIGSWQTARHLVIAMELADQTLWQRYEEAVAKGLPGIPRNELVEYFYEAAKGIDFLNEPRQQSDGTDRSGVQHRDIKPANILLVGGGVKVADFGLVRLLERTQTGHTGSMTPNYAPPEFFEAYTAQQSDQYSLAVTYCQLLSGRLPFEGSIAEIMRGHLMLPPNLSMLPEEDRSIVGRALSKKPADRWSTCLEFVQALRVGGSTKEKTRLSSSPVLLSRWILLAGTVLILIAVAVIRLWPKSVTKPGSEQSESSLIAKSEPDVKNVQSDEVTADVIESKQSTTASDVDQKMKSEVAVESDSVPAEPMVSNQDPAETNSAANASTMDPKRDETPKVEETTSLSHPEPEIAIVSKSTGMKLTLIPAGAFQMGSPATEAERFLREDPQHNVQITKPFYMGVYEVTQSQYEKLIGTNPSYFSANGGGRGKLSGQDTQNFPVEQVSWYDAIEFCNRLSIQDDFSPCYSLKNVQQIKGSISSAQVSPLEGNGYRLPTEAEWEYACRGETVSPFNFGGALNGDKANVDGNYPYGTAQKGNYLGRPASAGNYVVNKFGLFDMHGNVWEWCYDIYDERAYENRNEVTRDPVVTSGSDYRVQRGGSWNYSARGTRSAHRFWEFPNDRYHSSGFRVVRTVQPNASDES